MPDENSQRKRPVIETVAEPTDVSALTKLPIELQIPQVVQNQNSQARVLRSYAELLNVLFADIDEIWMKPGTGLIRINEELRALIKEKEDRERQRAEDRRKYMQAIIGFATSAALLVLSAAINLAGCPPA